MAIKNITLVEIQGELNKPRLFARHSTFDPIGLEYVGAVLEEKGYDVKIIRQENETSQKILEKILSTKPDIVGFSTYTFNFPYSKSLARMIKTTNPQIYTVFGNIHISSMPEDIDDTAIDFGIAGEGEYAFRDLVKALDKGNDVKNLESLIYWDNGIKINPRKPRIENLDELPFPLRTKEILEKNQILLMYPSKDQKVATMVYSRGCPYSCPFCSSRYIWGQAVRWRSAKNVVDEIEFLQKRYDINTIFFADLNFNSNREKVIELCDEIIKRNIDISWYPMLRLTTPVGKPMLDKELLEKMYAAGCKKVSFGIETFNENILQEYNKKISLNILKETLKTTHQLGFFNKGFFMIGHPTEDTKETLEETKRILLELLFDEIRFAFLTPFPETEIYKKYQDRIVTKDWTRYTSDEPIIQLDHLNREEIIEKRKDIVKSFYESPQYAKMVSSKIRLYPHLKDSYDEFFDFLAYEGINVSL